jgi:hypothetical protein
MKLYCTFFFYFTCMRGDTEKIKKTFPLNLYRGIMKVERENWLMSIIDEIWVIHLQKVDTLLMIGI